MLSSLLYAEVQDWRETAYALNKNPAAYLAGGASSFAASIVGSQSTQYILASVPFCTPVAGLLHLVTLCDSVERLAALYTEHDPVILKYNPTAYLSSSMIKLSDPSHMFKSSKDADWNQAFEQSTLIPHVRAAGFVFHTDSKFGTEWIVRNECSMPYSQTSIAGGRVFAISPDNQVLLVEEKFLKGIAMVPGGSNNPGELMKNTAAREMCEESGLKVKEKDLCLALLANRVRANRYGSNDFNHIYVTRAYTGKLRKQDNEISNLFWAPISEVASGKITLSSGQTLEVDLLTKMVAEQILQPARKTSEIEINDFIRQSQDSSDVMHISLFAVEQE